jgi:hypothetical protein
LRSRRSRSRLPRFRQRAPRHPHRAEGVIGVPGRQRKAKFQNQGQRELEIEVEHVRRLVGKRVNFFVNSTKVGSARVSGLGAAQVNRRGASFPAIKAGTRIKVKTAGGTTIVSGRF